MEGLKWLLLSAAQGQADARVDAESVQKDLTRAQVADAKQRAAAFSVAPRGGNAPRESGALLNPS